MDYSTTAIVAGATATAMAAFSFYTYKRIYPTVHRDFSPSTVVLRQKPRGPFAPSLSPFALKLETYLRMAKIDYVSDTESGFSSKGKFPWISYNNTDVSDSQFCIEYLNKKFDVDLNKHLSGEERGIAKAFQRLIEESLFWPMVMARMDFPEYHGVVKMMRKHFFAPRFLMPYVRYKLRKVFQGQGIGRHTHREVEQIAGTDLEALSLFLGDKPFLMGHEPSEVDCAAFGMLTQYKWHLPGTPYEKHFNETYPNLGAYCDRMKDRFWPDWDECITHDGTKTPSK